MGIQIKGISSALPEKEVNNMEIVQRINTTEQFITERTGVLTRRHIQVHESLSALLIPACKNAIADSGLQPEEIDMLLVNTLSPDHHDPSQACLIQPALGLKKIPAMDIRAQCSGMIYGMDIAMQFLLTGKCKNVLIACGEALSKRMDVSDAGRNLSILLGDGAGALVLSSMENEEKGIKDIVTHADGSFFHLLWTQAPGTANQSFNKDPNLCYDFRMKGKEMFEHAVECMTSVCNELLSRNQLTINDIDIIIPHQPNLRILETIKRILTIPDQKMYITVHKYGNMASASLPVALCEYMKKTDLSGKKALIVSYGSGATWGGILYHF